MVFNVDDYNSDLVKVFVMGIGSFIKGIFWLWDLIVVGFENGSLYMREYVRFIFNFSIINL